MFLPLLLLLPAPCAPLSPHVVLVIGDDVGWSDVSFTRKGAGSVAVPETPHLETLAGEGIVLDNFYVQVLRFCVLAITWQLLLVLHPHPRY